MSTLRRATALLLLALGLAACGSGPTATGPQPSQPAGVSGATSGADPGGQPGQTAAAQTSTTTSSHATTTATAHPSGKATATATPPAGGATPATPLAAGRYAYDTSGTMTVSGQAHQLPPTTTQTAAQAQNGRQLQTWDLRGSDGTGQVIEQTLAYSASSVTLAELKTTTYPGGNVSDVRDLFPTSTATVARTGAQPGEHQAFTMKGSDVTASFTVDVQRTETITVGTATVTAAVVEVDISFSGALTGRQTSTLWVTAEHLQIVRERVSSNVSNGLLTVAMDYTATLRTLTPS